MTDAERERIIDRRVQERLATDAAYRNAENAEEQAAREEEIEEAVERDLERHEGIERALTAEFGPPGTVTRIELPELEEGEAK